MDPPPPFEDQNSESEQKPENPLGIPPEIWDAVFDHLENGDLESVAKSCLAFENVADFIKSKRMRDILMPQVLQILTKKHVLYSMDIEVNDLILPLRGVCKQWRNVVDKLCEEQVMRWYSAPYSCEFSPPHIYIKRQRKLNRLIRCYDRTASSGIPARRVIQRRLQVETGNNPPKYYEDITRLLSIIGPKIWDFIISFRGPRHPFSKPEDLLVTWIKLLPNLRYLDVWWWQPDLTPLEQEEAKWTWKENPFPVLKDLKKIRFNENSDKRFPFASYLLKPNSQATTLNIDFDQLRMCLHSVHQLNLKILNLNYEYEEFEFGVTDLQPVLNYNWRLQHLFIGCGGGFETEQLFPLLERFKETLEVLSLFTSLIDNNINLDLPKITKLEITLNENCDNIDFLLQCQNLTNLRIDFTQEPDGHVTEELSAHFEIEDEREIVLLKGYLNDFYESNAWDLFPSLEEVTIEFDGWTKTCYKRIARFP